MMRFFLMGTRTRLLAGLYALWLAVTPPSFAQPTGSTVELDVVGDAVREPATASVVEVVATGIGATADTAKEQAFSAAIEQVVGVLVDAETIVENDQIVRDRVLTLSKGFVEKFEPVAQWQQDGLHHVRLRVSVSAKRLTESLQASKISVRDVAGELLFLQTRHEIANEEKGAEMFLSAMRDCSFTRLLTAEISGKPEIVARDATNVKMHIAARVRTNENNWRLLQGELKRILERLARKRGAFATALAQPEFTPEPYPFQFFSGLRMEDGERWAEFSRDVLDTERVIALMSHHSVAWSTTTWDVYVVPAGSVEDALGQSKLRRCKAAFRFLDANGGEIVRKEEDLGAPFSALNKALMPWMGPGQVSMFPGTALCQHLPGYWLGPVVFHCAMNAAVYSNSIVIEADIDVPLEQLKFVKKVQLSLVEASTSD